MAYVAGVQLLKELEPASRELVAGTELREQSDRMEGMLLSLQSSVTEVLEQQAEDRDRQDAVIAQLERMVLNMESTDRYADVRKH